MEAVGDDSVGWVISEAWLGHYRIFSDMFSSVRCRGLLEALSKDYPFFMLYYLVEKKFALVNGSDLWVPLPYGRFLLVRSFARRFLIFELYLLFFAE